MRLSRLKPLAVLTIFFSIILAFMLSALLINIAFANNFIPSVEVFSKYTSASTFGLEICAIREMLYAQSGGKELQFLSAELMQGMREDFTNSIQRLQKFVNDDLARIQEID